VRSYGGRYCDTSTTDGLPSASNTSGTTPTAPGERTMSRVNTGAVGRLELGDREVPHVALVDDRSDPTERRRRHDDSDGSEVVAPAPVGALSTSAVPSDSSVAARRASAAAISSRNSGCGRSGRLLNSGWAWVPTQNGWPGSSMNSTSRLSGDVPEHHRPASSSWLRYSLVELVAVAMAFADDRLAVRRGDLRTCGEHGVVGAEPHRAALVLDAALFEHQIDHRVVRRRIELGGVGVGEPDDVAGELDRHRLQSEAQPETRQPSSRA
jgi:hypothetical protein